MRGWPMGSTSLIEWTDATWNPIRGCSRVSEGCLAHVVPDDAIAGALIRAFDAQP